MIPASLRAGLAVALGGLAVSLASGCDNDAYCFTDCGPSGGSDGAMSGAGGDIFTGSGGAGGEDIFASSSSGSGAGAAPPCIPTNGSNETCDSIDNDCNDIVDDIPGQDLGAAVSCGTCSNNCHAKLLGCDLGSITCTPSPDPGKVPGECVCNKCVDDYFDIDGNGTCEYYCVKSADNDATCDNKDDDCDFTKDEDVDLCASTENCGKCGAACVILHGEAECVHTGVDPCDPSNTQCAVKDCTCTGAGDCWWDLDGLPGTGCEYQCDETNGGVEICGDGIDNDCNGKIDSADNLMGDPLVGKPCFGDPDGECATAAHAGVYACSGNQVVCAGANVLKENDASEICNNKDDDCDGVIDDTPANVGDACGVSNLAPCKFGKLACQGGALVCAGAVNPVAETCDGIDNDCDGSIDFTMVTAMPPADSVGPCDVPPMPPAGATSPCVAGTKACIGGVVACQGSVGPSGPNDGCGVDANCDGQLTNQPNLMSDVSNCGMCGNDCYAGAEHALWSCQSGACVFGGCEPDYYDLNADNKCEYQCISNGPETCNNADDDCDGVKDEGIIGIPTPTQACGVSPSATSNECKANVTVSCQGGAWKCTFPAGVCSPTCDAAVEICDGLDNDCDGALNENVPTFGKPCASDDASPVPGDGACRTIGSFVCDGATAVKCNAVTADCSTLLGGCTEVCDGIDNDCDGSVDEPFTDKGMDEGFFVKPDVTKISSGPDTWMFSYEASRPNATGTTAGIGNGYHSSAPPGETLDQTTACSVPGKIPWFNVSPVEVEQTCAAMGGTVCATASWQTACQPDVECKWGYAPRGGAGSACATGFTTMPPKRCNLGMSFDFDPGTPEIDNGLLATGALLADSCWADWTGLLGNMAGADKVLDLTGNLREIVKQGAGDYRLMGGAFTTQSEEGATCSFTFYSVASTFKFYDTGFRCCFAANPTI